MRSNCYRGDHVPDLTFEVAAVGLFGAFDSINTPRAPLFEKEINIRPVALVAQTNNPLLLHRPRGMARLAALF